MKVYTKAGRVRAEAVCDCDDGWVYDGGRAARCSKPSHGVARRINAAGVPGSLLCAMRGSIDETASRTDVLRRECELWSGQLRGLMFIGDLDSGKSHTAAWLIRQAADIGIAGVWATAREIDSQVKATFDGEGRRSAVMARLVEAPLLVIDEMKAATPFTAALLGDVIGERYERSAHGAVHPTIVTGNGSESAMASVLAPHIWSRLRSMAPVIQFKRTGHRGVAA